MPTIEVSDLQSWANDSEQAIANIKSLLSAMASSDSTILAWATEALENCGTPRFKDAEWVSGQLFSETPDISYWAATLLGRLGDEASHYQQILIKLAAEATRPRNVRQRALWALGRMNTLSEESKITYQKLREDMH